MKQVTDVKNQPLSRVALPPGYGDALRSINVHLREGKETRSVAVKFEHIGSGEYAAYSDKAVKGLFERELFINDAPGGMGGTKVFAMSGTNGSVVQWHSRGGNNFVPFTWQMEGQFKHDLMGDAPGANGSGIFVTEHFIAVAQSAAPAAWNPVPQMAHASSRAEDANWIS